MAIGNAGQDGMRWAAWDMDRMCVCVMLEEWPTEGVRSKVGGDVGELLNNSRWIDHGRLEGWRARA